MPARIHLRGETWYSVEGYRDDIVRLWEDALAGDGSPLATFERLDGGIPRPRITVNLRELVSVEEEKR